MVWNCTPWITRIGLVFAFGLAGLAAAEAAPDDAKDLGVYKDWVAKVMGEGSDKVCFVSAKPTRSRYSQSINARDNPFFMVTHWQAQNIFGQPSVLFGYKLKPNSTATIRIGSEKFTLSHYADDSENADRAWIEDPKEEKKLVAAMKAGATMVVTGYSRRGTRTRDTYSLSGVTAALERISRECK